MDRGGLRNLHSRLTIQRVGEGVSYFWRVGINRRKTGLTKQHSIVLQVFCIPVRVDPLLTSSFDEATSFAVPPAITWLTGERGR